MCEIYQHFARNTEVSTLDFSDESRLALYSFETFGKGEVSPLNGFAVGKKWMDVTVSMWREDLGTLLFKQELYADPNYPKWWLDKVLP